MEMAANPQRRYTLEEYFEPERKPAERFELRDGEVLCVSGVSEEQDQIEPNLIFYLRAKLAGRKRRAFLADMRLKVQSAPP